MYLGKTATAALIVLAAVVVLVLLPSSMGILSIRL